MCPYLQKIGAENTSKDGPPSSRVVQLPSKRCPWAVSWDWQEREEKEEGRERCRGKGIEGIGRGGWGWRKLLSLFCYQWITLLILLYMFIIMMRIHCIWSDTLCAMHSVYSVFCCNTTPTIWLVNALIKVGVVISCVLSVPSPPQCHTSLHCKTSPPPPPPHTLSPVTAEWLPDHAEESAHCWERVPWVCGKQRLPRGHLGVAGVRDVCGHQTNPPGAGQWADPVQLEWPWWEHDHGGLQLIW